MCHAFKSETTDDDHILGSRQRAYMGTGRRGSHSRKTLSLDKNDMARQNGKKEHLTALPRASHKPTECVKAH